MPQLKPLSLKDAPSLIEAVFPAQKISFEAQKERKANLGQTLTGLGSYWKGRKPLILVRAIVIGCLLPQTGDPEKDLEIFEKLMGLDEESLARRALVQNKLKPVDIAALVNLENPWDYFSYSIKDACVTSEELGSSKFPLDAESTGIDIKWRRDIRESDKLALYRKALDTFSSYEEKANYCKRPEELDQEWLYEPVWPLLNQHFAYLNITARSHQELVEQVGYLRYGCRPRVGDTFTGGGSIPFEAARLGCDVYAADLNPIACMLSWGALNILSKSPDQRADIERTQRRITSSVDVRITDYGLENDKDGNRAKAYLYCLETQCPESGWLVPLSPSWVISKSKKVIAKLIPNHDKQRFEIEVLTNVSKEELTAAEQGTVRGGALIYELNGKTYQTPIKTLRGDYRDADGNNRNQLRRWNREDFKPSPNDIFQERLYAVQWIARHSLNQSRKETFFAAATADDLKREQQVDAIVEKNISKWQSDGLIPDMEIDAGKETTRLGRERGWAYWHHLFSPRGILCLALTKAEIKKAAGDAAPYSFIALARTLDFASRLSYWESGLGKDLPGKVFSNQALNTWFAFGVRSSTFLLQKCFQLDLKWDRFPFIENDFEVCTSVASRINSADQIPLFITDPPYADAVNYHEITEFFIAWLRENPPEPFDQWTWDSRRALAIKGTGDDFRRGMVDAYSAMTVHMPENGMQCVMFTHQDTGVWSDMIGIFWAAGLQVVAAWYIATETTSELKKGGYVQGTVILMLRKRAAIEKSGFKQRILPAVRNEVKRQIEQMMNLNDEVKQRLGEPVFNDSDLQMAGYAAALKVLTAYTHIGGEDVTSFALRPRQRGEATVVDEIVQQAAEAANSLLVPEGLSANTWQRISGIQRFYLRMVDMETTGASKLDNYQNFAKAFRVDDYTKVMGNITANKARLKQISEFKSRDLTGSTEIGATWLGRLVIGLQQLLADTDPQVVISQLQMELPDFMEVRPILIDILQFLQAKASEEETRNVAEVLANRLRNLRALGQ